MKVRCFYMMLLILLSAAGCGTNGAEQDSIDTGQTVDADTPDSGPAPDLQTADMGTADSATIDAGPSPPEPESFVLENVQNDFIYRLSFLSVTDRGIFGIGPVGGPVVVELNQESPAFVDSWAEVATFLTTGAVNADYAVVTTSPRLSGNHTGDGVWAWVVDLNRMEVVGTTPLPDCVAPSAKVVMNDTLAVIPCFYRRVYLLDFSDPTDPRTIMQHEPSSWRSLLTIEGDAEQFSFTYVGEGEIRRVSRSSLGLESNEQVSQFEQSWIYYQIVTGDGRLWSFGGGFNPQIESVSLTSQGEITAETHALSEFPELAELEDVENGIGYYDQKLFLAGNYPDGKRIIVIDVQDPANPVLIGSQYSLDDIARVNGFAFYDGRAYIYGAVNRGGGREPILVVPVAGLLD